MKKVKTVPPNVVGAVRQSLSDGLAYVTGTHTAVQAVRANDSDRYRSLTNGLKAPEHTPWGVLIVNVRRRHPDALSVGRGWILRSTEDRAVTESIIWIRATPEGGADIEYLTRDNGKLAKFVG
jgi:hypothetical protein